MTGFLQTNTYNSKGYVHTVPLELVDDGDTVALTYNNGWSGNLIKINTLKGTGTLKTQDSGLGEHIYIVDGSGFTGVFNLVGKYVYVGGSQPDSLDQANPGGKLEIRAGTTLTVSSGKTWTANGGFVVDGTLNVNGTLSSSHASKAVSGSGTVIYTGKAPNTGTAWWKENWTGTVEIKDYATSLGNFNLTAYGNSESKVCMNGANGYLLSKGSSGSHDIKELIIGSGGFTQNGSYSVVNEFVVPCKVTGSGTYTFSAAGTGQKTLYFTGDMSEFAGVISIGGTNNRVLVGTSTDRAFTANTLIVGDDGVLSIASGKTWNPSSGMFIDNGGLVVNNGFIWTTGGITVDGELRAPNHKDYFGGGTTITTTDNGVFTLTSTGNGEESETDTSYARITGTGTLKYEGTGWRALSTNNFPTAMTLANEQAGDILLSRTLTYTIGSLSGTKNIQGNYGSGARYLRVLQSKDTEWSGKVIADDGDRFKGLTVAPGASAAGTLTLSGTQVKSQTLTVESGAKVNLTGTWIGNTTVAGTFGGTGTLTGDLTLSNGATLKVDNTSDTLQVNNLTVSGTVSVELPAGTASGTLITTTAMPDVSGAKFNVYVDGNLDKSLCVIVTPNGLKIKRGVMFLFH